MDELDPTLRDPLVEVLTERAAVLIYRNRELAAELVALKLDLGKARSEIKQLTKQLDDLVLREAARQDARSS